MHRRNHPQGEEYLSPLQYIPSAWRKRPREKSYSPSWQILKHLPRCCQQISRPIRCFPVPEMPMHLSVQLQVVRHAKRVASMFECALRGLLSRGPQTTVLLNAVGVHTPHGAHMVRVKGFQTVAKIQVGPQSYRHLSAEKSMLA